MDKLALEVSLRELPLVKAAERGETEEVARLLAGADLLEKNAALHAGAAGWHAAIFHLLLEAGADEDGVVHGTTPLHRALLIDGRDHAVASGFAYRSGREGGGATVKLLLDKGAQVNATAMDVNPQP